MNLEYLTLALIILWYEIFENSDKYKKTFYLKIWKQWQVESIFIWKFFLG